MIRKTGRDDYIVDIEPLYDKYPNAWAVIMDKGYQGGSENVRAVFLSKEPKNRIFKREEEAKNKKI